MAFAMCDNHLCEGLCFFLRQQCPKFTSQGDGGNINIARSLIKELLDKHFIHRGTTAMSVEMACSQLHSLAKHDTKGYILNAQLMGHLQGFANIIAILHKCLCRQVNIC